MELNVCCTDRKLVSLKYEWTIKKFMIYFDEAKYQKYSHIIVKSSNFLIGDDVAQWELQLYYQMYGNTAMYEIHLCRAATTPREASTFIKLSIKNNNGEELNPNRKFYKFVSGPQQVTCLVFNNDDTILDLAGIKNMNDSITFVCEIHVLGESINSPSNHLVQRAVNKNLSNDIEQLVKDKELSDVTFVIKEKKIRAHKAILAARSPVFAAMFKHENEKQSHEVTDIDSKVFDEMLLYIYTDSVSDTNDVSIYDLLNAADKYQIEGLKEICERTLWRNINFDNAAETLIFADLHSLQQLSEQTRNYIHQNIVDVMKTTGYQLMENNYPKLSLSLCRFSIMKIKDDETNKET